MGLDIRLPIGFLFSIFGVLLITFGALGDKTIYERSLGININLEWGIVMLLFGALMLFSGPARNQALKQSGHRTSGVRPRRAAKTSFSAKIRSHHAHHSIVTRYRSPLLGCCAILLLAPILNAQAPLPPPIMLGTAGIRNDGQSRAGTPTSR